MDPEAPLSAFEEAVHTACALSFDPEEAWTCFQRLLGNSNIADMLEQAGVDALRRAAQIFSLGGALAEWLQSQPQLFEVLAAEPLAPGVDDIVFEAQNLATSDDTSAGRWRELRWFRRRRTLQIAAAELVEEHSEAGPIGTEAASYLLSVLAREILELALKWSGLDKDLAVLALGKLGGMELNYASDVDLIYLARRYDPSLEGRARQMTAELESRRSPGRIFVVDLRLRPYGRSGALCPSIDSVVQYYNDKGCSWERQALVRARCIAGAKDVGAEFFKRIEDFLWNRGVEQADIANMLKLRDQTQKHVERPELHLKHGPGGIRELEFVVQFLQILHGRQRPELREAGTRPALRSLQHKGLLSKDHVEQLLESYRFLRAVEHRLQLRHDREHEWVPESGPERQSLALSLGYSEPQFDERLAKTRKSVRDFLNLLVATPFADDDEAPESASLKDFLLSPQDELERGAALLEQRGFRDGPAAYRRFRRLAQPKNSLGAFAEHTRTFLAGLAPRLLKAFTDTGHADRCLKNFELAIENLGAKAMFYQLLLESPDTLQLFVKLCSASEFLIETLARMPRVMDHVFDMLMTNERPKLEVLLEECRQALRDEQPLVNLLTVKASTMLLVGIHDLAGRYNVQNVGRDLSILAEALLQALFEWSVKVLADKHGGRPKSDSGEDVGLAILALGKLGGRELSYGSDYDLIVIYESAGHCPDGTSAQAFYEDCVRQLLSAAETKVGGLRLAHLDLRLRPAGSKGRLASVLSFAEAYYSGQSLGDRAANWESLAQVKLRAVAGDRDFAKRCERALIEIRKAQRFGPEIWADIGKLRELQKQQCLAPNLKRGSGGLVDIEFLVGTLLLRHGLKQGEAQSNTADLILQLAQQGTLTDSEQLGLRTALQYLRQVEARLRVLDGRSSSDLPMDPKELNDLAMRLGYVGSPEEAGQTFLEEWRHHGCIVDDIVATVRARDMDLS